MVVVLIFESGLLHIRWRLLSSFSCWWQEQTLLMVRKIEEGFQCKPKKILKYFWREKIHRVATLEYEIDWREISIILPSQLTFQYIPFFAFQQILVREVYSIIQKKAEILSIDRWSYFSDILWRNWRNHDSKKSFHV